MKLFWLRLLGAFWIALVGGAGSSLADGLTLGGLECLENGEVYKEEGKLACAPGLTIRAAISGLEDWQPSGENPSENKLADLVLTIDGYVLTGLVGVLDAGGDKRFLQYELDRTPENRDSWQAVLKRTNFLATRKMSFAIREREANIFYTNTQMEFRVASLWRALAMLAFFVTSVVVFVWLVREGNMLREAGAPLPNGKKRPFSLARTQMAFWFFLILFGFIFLWMMTGALDTLTNSVLGLAGISAATGLSAVAIGGSDNYVETRSTDELKTEIDALEKQLNKHDETVKATEAEPTEADKEKRQLMQAKLDKARRGSEWVKSNARLNGLGRFLRDLFSNNGQAAFSRYQIIVWTLVLGIVFCHSLWTTLAMPEFNNTLLGLMGISGGTYVGFKFPQTPSA